MPRKSGIDWAAVQADRDAGVPVTELVKKYGVSNPSIYTKTKSNKNGNDRAGGQKRPRPQKPGGRFSKAARSLDTADILAELRKRRDALTSAIEAIERLEKLCLIHMK